MPTTCNFELDHPDGIYYSGQTINGLVNLNTTSNKFVHGVYILFEGKGKVRWDDRGSRNSDGTKRGNYRENYRSDRTYLDSRTEVFGSGELPEGTHTYTISIPLPLECPSSVVLKYGKIFYEISLVLDCQLAFNKIFKQPLTVIQVYNLNMYPEMLIPLERADIKYFCCWPCRSGPVLFSLIIPFGGYAPGQYIRFTLQIDNQSSKYDLEGIDLSLKQIYKFTAESPYLKERKKEKTLKRRIFREPVLRLTKRIFTGSLKVPPVLASNRINDIIMVSYRLILQITLGECHGNSEFDVPIIIGTIPLADSIEDPTLEEPPTFEEAMKREGSSDEDDYSTDD